MNIKLCMIGFLTAALLLATACKEQPTNSGAKNATTQPAAQADASGRCPHDIKQEKCPFCNPKLVEAEGFCGEHGVPEALCAQCRPYLKAAFRAKGDWCKEHNTPESQCPQCHPDLRDKMRPGEHGATAPAAGVSQPSADAGQCLHGIASTQCPFCTPALIEAGGFCKEHGVDEALCVKCRPYLETAFKANGDWCAEHKTPESQCLTCHPELKNKPKGQG